MCAEAGVRQNGESCDKGLTSRTRVLLAYSLVAILSAGFVGAGVEHSKADPVERVSYTPADEFVVLSLKDSVGVTATIRQETFSSRYDVVSKPAETATAVEAIEHTPVSVDLAQALTSQAACQTGALFDECPGFIDVLQSRQQAWPRFTDTALPGGDAPLTTGSVPHAIVASAREDVGLLTEASTAAVDRLSMRAGEVIMGAASMYNPYDRNDNDAGGAQTASGELYDPVGWTAAIQIKLRDKFAGVRYGRLYQPTFALVELNGRRAIVRINDVGPLRPGRVIDFSQQAMHYFDPSLRRGVLDGMLVTPLVGSNWTPGPLGTAPAVAVASNNQ